MTVGMHLRYLARDGTLPVGDAAGHLVNCARALLWLRGGPLPAEAFPPGVYTVSALVMSRFGASVDNAAAGVALFGGLLAAALAWFGWRASGAVAAVLLPLLALAAPMLAGMARLVLLDLPATACIAVIWVLVWESGAFRRPLPTLLLGAALAGGALVKYTLFLWVAPLLVASGIVLVVRAPGAVVPLLTIAPVLRMALLDLQMRSSAPLVNPGDAAALHAVEQWLALGAAVQAGILLIAWVVPGDKAARWRAGLRQGAWLALAALLAVALVLPWFHHAMPAVWKKVHEEAIEQVRSSGTGDATRFALGLLFTSWPRAWWWIQLGAGLEIAWIGAEIGRWAVPRIRRVPGGPSLDPARLVAGGMVAASCLLGSWLTAIRLPVDPRYYLPLLVGGCVLIGLGVCRFRLGRWIAAPVLALVCLVQLAGDANLGTLSPVRLQMVSFDPAVLQRIGRWALFAPPAPRGDPLAVALEALMGEVASVSPTGDCNRVLVAVPRFSEGRGVGLEGRTLSAIGQLHGLEECALAEWTPESRPGTGTGARFVAVAALRLTEVAGVPGVTGEPRWSADVAGRAVRLYTRDAPAQGEL